MQAERIRWASIRRLTDRLHVASRARSRPGQPSRRARVPAGGDDREGDEVGGRKSRPDPPDWHLGQAIVLDLVFKVKPQGKTNGTRSRRSHAGLGLVDLQGRRTSTSLGPPRRQVSARDVFRRGAGPVRRIPLAEMNFCTAEKRGFLLPDRMVMSDSTGSFILTSLRDAGFLRRICYYSARHEAGAVNPICLLKALASCSYGWVVSDSRS